MTSSESRVADTTALVTCHTSLGIHFIFGCSYAADDIMVKAIV
ncbi:MAG: hypothetical protein Q7J76_09560 [Candidatus Brocadiaceae bacterium]|nr:hypothetical protein [Candidatus Brocadiaceae bacterium]